MFFCCRIPKAIFNTDWMQVYSAKMFLDFTQSEMQFPLLDLFNKEMWILDIMFENSLLHF